MTACSFLENRQNIYFKEQPIACFLDQKKVNKAFKMLLL